MEDVYLKGFMARREWCSDKVNLRLYFEKYAKAVGASHRKKVSEIDILQHFVPQSNQLSEEELNQLQDITDAEQLTTLFGEDFTMGSGQSTDKIKENHPSNSKDKKNINSSMNDSHDKSETLLESKNEISFIKKRGYKGPRNQVLLDATEKLGCKDLTHNVNFLVSFRVHAPFSHRVGDNARPGRCAQEIRVLGHQLLTSLRDKIICESDFQDTRGDVSEQPDAPATQIARDKYFSSMFYLDNTFYVDKRLGRNLDYSEPIMKWANNRGLHLGDCVSMENTQVCDLEVRFGYPYVYIHQGCCEHLVIINDARLLTATDSLYTSDYPLIMRVTHHNMIYCMVCARMPARWIVRDSDRLAHDPTYMCRACFKSLHYINGKKVKSFRAYQYWQRSSIL